MESGEIINNSYKGFEERTSDINNIKRNKKCSTKIIIISISISIIIIYFNFTLLDILELISTFCLFQYYY